MKNFYKKLLVFLCLFSVFATSLFVSAEGEYPNGHITIDNLSAANGESVFVRLILEDNPGIMAMTISITYDSSALTLEKKYYGIFKDNMVVDHPNQNLIRYVSCEKNDNFSNGNMLYLKFKVKDDAEAGFYPVNIDYKSGDFCNWKLEKLMPKVTAGGVEVKFNGTNCSHKKYGEWQVAAEPTCKAAGAKQRFCTICNHCDIADIPIRDHYFENHWIIDKEATPEEEGSMSRHCRYCEATTDVITFTFEQSKEENLNSSNGGIVAPSDFTDKLVKEQLPEVYKNNGGSSLPKENEDPAQIITNEAPASLSSGIKAVTGENTQSIIGKALSVIPDLDRFGVILLVAFIILLKLII